MADTYEIYMDGVAGKTFDSLPPIEEDIKETDGLIIHRDNGLKRVTGEQWKNAIKAVIVESGAGAGMAVESKAVLESGKWTGDEPPFEYDLGSDYQDVAVTIGLDSTKATTEQVDAANDAAIQGSTGTVLYAYGEKPDVDIPIIIRSYATKKAETSDSDESGSEEAEKADADTLEKN